MVQTLNVINELSERGVQLSFGRQPKLSTTGPHAKLLLAIYSYFAETERELISLRTKQRLAAARAKGKKLGRPKGSRNKERVLDPYRDEILAYLEMGGTFSIDDEGYQSAVGNTNYLQFISLLCPT